MTVVSRCQVVQHTPHGGHVEQSTDLRAWPEDLFAERVAVRPGDPLANRNREAALRKRCERGRQAAPCELAEEDLAGPAAELAAGRNAERELDHFAIEQRAAHLQAVRHAHAVHLHQRIVRHVDLEVGVLRPLKRLRGRAATVRLGDGIVDGAVGQVVT